MANIDEKLINYGGLSHFYDELKVNDLDTKQDTLTAGKNISIEDNTIEAEGYTYNSTNNAVALNTALYIKDTCKVTSIDETNRTITLDSLGTYNFDVDDVIAAENGGSYALITAVNGNTLTLDKWVNFIVGEIVYAVETTFATGQGSVTEGILTRASGAGAHAEGYRTQALKNFTHAEGYKTVANYAYAHVEGQENTVIGRWGAHAEGRGNTINGNGYASHVEGKDNNLDCMFSHVEGTGNTLTSTGSANHIEGAGNSITTAAVMGAHVGGLNNIGATSGELVCGTWNVQHGGDYQETHNYPNWNTIFVVGNGVNTVRSNAFEVMQGGDVYIVGVGNYQGTDTKRQNNTIQPLQDVITSIQNKVNPITGSATLQYDSNRNITGIQDVHFNGYTISDLLALTDGKVRMVFSIEVDSALTTESVTCTGILDNITSLPTGDTTLLISFNILDNSTQKYKPAYLIYNNGWNIQV